MKQLYYFAETCKRMNIAETAKALYLTPQALSKSIRRLEEELGGEVFERTGNTIALTDYGHLLYQRAALLLEDFERLEGDMKNASRQLHGCISVGFDYDILPNLPPEAVCSFMDEHPGVQLDLRELPSEALEQELLDGVLDFVFEAGLPYRESLFDAQLVYHTGLCVVMRKDNPLYGCKELTVADLRGEKLIGHNHLSKVSLEFYSRCQASGFTPEYLLRTPSVEINKRAMWKMGGISLSPQSFCEDYPYSDLVSYVPLAEEEGLSWDIYLLTPKGRPSSPLSQQLADHLIQALAGCKRTALS